LADHIWIAERCGANTCASSTLAPILEFDRDGKLLNSFAAGLMAWPHGMSVDAHGNIWVADGRAENGKGQTVFKFDQQGRLLLTLGRPGVSGSDFGLLNRPSDVTVARDGSIFVADGHGVDSNDRIVKFNSRGEFIQAWGSHGSERGQFNTIHAIVVDAQDRLLVADRDNNRVQVFDQSGKWLTEWRQFAAPTGLVMGNNGLLYVAAAQPEASANQGIFVASATDGAVLAFIPGMPTADGKGLASSEDIAVDSRGNLYGARGAGPMLYRNNSAQE
jgi:DNA-binding beta-propeller fold protein YncE